MNESEKQRRSLDRLNRIQQTWEGLDSGLQIYYMWHAETLAQRHLNQAVKTEAGETPQLSIKVRSLLEQESNRGHGHISLQARASSFIRHPAFAVGQILTLVIIQLGYKPKSKVGQVVRHLLAATWILICVLPWVNRAQSDTWNITYGVVGLIFLGLVFGLAFSFAREQRKWAAR